MTVQRVLGITQAVLELKDAAELYERMFFDIADVFPARLEPQGRDSTVVKITNFYVELVSAHSATGILADYAKRYGGFFKSMFFLVDDVIALRLAIEPYLVTVFEERAHYLVVEVKGMAGTIWEFTDLPEKSVVQKKSKTRAIKKANALNIHGVGSFSMLVDDIPIAAEFMTRALGGTIKSKIHDGSYTHSQQLHLAGLVVSLLHPKRDDQILAKVLSRQGNSIHSFSLAVDDMEASRKVLLTRGVAVLREQVKRVTIHPRSAFGARILLMPKNEGW